MDLAAAAEVHDGHSNPFIAFEAARAAWLADARFRRLSPVTIREYARISGALLSHLPTRSAARRGWTICGRLADNSLATIRALDRTVAGPHPILVAESYDIKARTRFGGHQMSQAQMIERLEPPRWVVVVQSVAAIVIGLLLVLAPGASSVVLVQMVGIYWLVGGIVALVSLAWDRTLWGWTLLSGVLGILAGLAIIRHPLWGTVIVERLDSAR